MMSQILWVSLLPPPPPPPPLSLACKKVTFTYDFQEQNRRKTLSGNNNSFSPNVFNMNSSQTLEVASTSRDPACELYWNKQVAEWSQKLWLPIGTDYVDSHMILSNTFLNSMVQDSWFSHKMAPPMTKLNSVKISLPSTLSLSVGCKENGQQGLFRVYLFILYLSNNIG